MKPTAGGCVVPNVSGVSERKGLTCGDMKNCREFDSNLTGV